MQLTNHWVTLLRLNGNIGMHDIQPACTRILFKNQVNVHIESLVNDSAYQMKRNMILVNSVNWNVNWQVWKCDEMTGLCHSVAF